jgi:hypothetical protein
MMIMKPVAMHRPTSAADPAREDELAALAAAPVAESSEADSAWLDDQIHHCGTSKQT